MGKLTRHSLMLAFAGLCGLAATSTSSAAGAEDWLQVRTVVTGTAHQALYSLALSKDAAIAVGANGQILESTDLGATWKAANSPAKLNSLFGVATAHESQIVVGQHGTILVKQQARWVRVDSGTDNRLFSVSLAANGLAVAVGGFGTVLKSGDGGSTWISIAPKWSDFAQDGVEPHIYDVDIATSNAITIVGEFGLILRSQDQGHTWAVAHKGDASLFALDLRRPDGIGYAVGQNATVLRTADYGSTWIDVGPRGSSILLGVRSAPDGRVYVTGMRDMLASTDDGRTWQRLRDHDFVSAWYQGLAFEPTGRSILIVGHSGRILQVGSK